MVHLRPPFLSINFQRSMVHFDSPFRAFEGSIRTTHVYGPCWRAIHRHGCRGPSSRAPVHTTCKPRQFWRTMLTGTVYRRPWARTLSADLVVVQEPAPAPLSLLRYTAVYKFLRLIWFDLIIVQCLGPRDKDSTPNFDRVIVHLCDMSVVIDLYTLIWYARWSGPWRGAWPNMLIMSRDLLSTNESAGAVFCFTLLRPKLAKSDYS